MTYKKLPSKRQSVSEGLCFINEPKEHIDTYMGTGSTVKKEYFQLVCKELGYVAHKPKVQSARLILEANGIHWEPQKHESTGSTVTALTLKLITDILRARDEQL